jgi:hypothetical protein
VVVLLRRERYAQLNARASGEGDRWISAFWYRDGDEQPPLIDSGSGADVT